jgi:hypothetical protein
LFSIVTSAVAQANQDQLNKIQGLLHRQQEVRRLLAPVAMTG